MEIKKPVTDKAAQSLQLPLQSYKWASWFFPLYLIMLLSWQASFFNNYEVLGFESYDDEQQRMQMSNGENGSKREWNLVGLSQVCSVLFLTRS